MKYTGLATHLIENPAEDIPTLLREIRTRPVAEMAAILDEGERRSAGGGEGANAAAPVRAEKKKRECIYFLESISLHFFLPGIIFPNIITH